MRPPVEDSAMTRRCFLSRSKAAIFSACGKSDCMRSSVVFEAQSSAPAVLRCSGQTEYAQQARCEKEPERVDVAAEGDDSGESGDREGHPIMIGGAAQHDAGGKDEADGDRRQARLHGAPPGRVAEPV